MDDALAVDPNQPLQTLLPQQLGARGSHEHRWAALRPSDNQTMQCLPAVFEDRPYSFDVNKDIQKLRDPGMSRALSQHDLQQGVLQ